MKTVHSYKYFCMKIKDIRRYRTYYKEKVRNLAKDEKRNEHYLGTTYFDNNENQHYGWFDIYHGDKEGVAKDELSDSQGIRNYLESFLDMAKDSQAVYEFLQNAVDASSSHFTITWGKDEVDGNYYLLVANNGDTFDFDGVRSILNVGSSTKSADSQTIGKFGIGFKLAHRLVGKDSGLDELINKNYGPILFSWGNNEILNVGTVEGLETSSTTFTSKRNKHKINEPTPWLFKILLTCFPCLPKTPKVSDTILPLNRDSRLDNAFETKELEALFRWIEKRKKIFKNNNYSKGALFFLRLGEGKETQLGDENLKEGIKFSLAILNETSNKNGQASNVLNTIQVNKEEPITLPDLKYLQFSFPKNSNEYSYVRFGVDLFEDLNDDQIQVIKKEADIEVLIGYRDYDKIGNYFKEAPNFYLFFPLSEEIHRFNFILHSNAFYKASSRTFLQRGSGKNGGINERLLERIVEFLKRKFDELSKSETLEKQDQFLDIYAAFLTSARNKINKDREWVIEPFINPFNELLKNYIPIKSKEDSTLFEIRNTSENIFWKKTRIDLFDWEFENVDWFFFEKNEFRSPAKSKLTIHDFSIYDLLCKKEIFSKINDWIGTDVEKVIQILKEIDQELKTKIDEERNNKIFINNLVKINILPFENGEILSFEELLEKGEDRYLLLDENLSVIYDELIEIDLIVSKIKFDQFTQLVGLQRINSDYQIKNKVIALDIFSKQINEENSSKFTIDKKVKIFKVFQNRVATTTDLKKLKLFKNEQGEIIKLEWILLKTRKDWLKDYVINSEEKNEDIVLCLVKKDSSIYPKIIYRFWNDIIFWIQKNQSKAKSIFYELKQYYDSWSHSKKKESVLSQKENVNLIFQGKLFEVTEEIKLFFSHMLKDLDENRYLKIQSLLKSKFDLYLPDQFLVPYLYNEPLSFTSTKIDVQEELSFSAQEIELLMLVEQTTELNILSRRQILLTEVGDFQFKKSGYECMYFTQNEDLENYLQKYSHRFFKIPKELVQVKLKSKISDDEILENIVKDFDEDKAEPRQLIELLDTIKKSNLDLKLKLFEKISSITFDNNWENEEHNKTIANYINEILNEEKLCVEDISEKISLALEDDTALQLSDFHQINDTLIIKYNEKEYQLSQSMVLDVGENHEIGILQSFANALMDKELLGKKKTKKIFKLKPQKISEGLTDNFKKSLVNNNLKNADQLAFVLLSEDLLSKEYKCEFEDDEWHEVSQQIFISNNVIKKYVDPSYIISEKYSSIEDKLNIDHKSIFSIDKNDEDDEDNNDDDYISLFISPNLRITEEVIKEGIDTIEFLNYLFKNWKFSKSKEMIWDSKVLTKAFGFIPELFLDIKQSLKEELLPNNLKEWMKEEKAYKFFKYLGYNIHGTKVSKLRDYITFQTNELQEINLEEFPLQLKINSLEFIKYLETENGKEFVYLKEQQQTEVISDLVLQVLSCDGIVEEEPFYCLIHKDMDQFKMVKVEEVYCFEDEEHKEMIDKLSVESQRYLYGKYSTAFFNEDLNDAFSYNQKIDLVPELDFILDQKSLEPEDSTYDEWSKENGIKLFKIDGKLKYKVLVCIDEEDAEEFGNIEWNDLFVDENTDCIYYNFRDLTPQNLVSELKSSKGREYSNKVDSYFDLSSDQAYNLEASMQQKSLENLDKRKYDRLKEKSKKENERDHLLDKLVDLGTENLRYSYDWFLIYLDFLNTYQELNNQINQKEIYFTKIDFCLINEKKSEKHFILKGASRPLPLAIEEYEDFTLNVKIKNQAFRNIEVQGVSRKGQDLYIFCPKGIKEEIKKNFKKVINISIRFTPILDLLQRLIEAFGDELESWDSIKDALPGLEYIYGPPGTGKTTELCNLIKKETKDNPDCKILVLTPTNKAADVLVKKIMKTDPDFWAIRLGNPTDPELQEMNEDLYRSSITYNEISGCKLVATTIHRLPYFKFLDEENEEDFKLYELEDHWDFIFFDESSMIGLHYFVFASMIFKNQKKTKFIVSGDPLQIPPVDKINDRDLAKKDIDLDEENVYKMLDIKNFKSAKKSIRLDVDKMKLLKKQYRSVYEIGSLFGKYSYDDLISHSRKKGKSKPKELPTSFAFLSKPISRIDFEVNKNNSIKNIRKLSGSSYNIYASILVAELLKKLGEETEVKLSIGIISPYKSQAVLTNKLISAYGISTKLDLHCDTVHGFQGDECDIVIFIINPNRYSFTGHKNALLSKNFIYNVAVSRARDYLWMFYPYSDIPNNSHVNTLSSITEELQGNEKTISGNELEEFLFSNSEFIDENSYLTGHDTINIYGQVDMKYFIKVDEDVVDIQLGKPGS